MTFGSVATFVVCGFFSPSPYLNYSLASCGVAEIRCTTSVFKMCVCVCVCVLFVCLFFGGGGEGGG